MESKVIETGVDKLVTLVKSRGRLALSDAAKELGLSSSVIQEWVDFLEEEGILSVEYKLTKPFLIDKKLTKKEVDAMEKEFSSKKDSFVRKAESNLGFLERQADDLKKIKNEFDKLKNDLGLELDKVKTDLKELEKYQDLRQELEKELQNQKVDSKTRMEDLTKQIEREQKRYLELVSNIKKEGIILSKEKSQAKSIEDAEKTLAGKLAEFKAMIVTIEKKMVDENSAVKNTEDHIGKLQAMMNDIGSKIEEEKGLIEPLVQKSKDLEDKIHDLQNNILKKLKEKKEDSNNAKDITKKFQAFFDKKLDIIELVDKLSKDRNELEISLIDLVKKAKSYELAKDKDVGKDLQELEKKFTDVDKKRGVFETELKKLTSFFKKE